MPQDTLEEAVTQCLLAAQQECVAATQKMLLTAALFGKSFLPEMNPEGSQKAALTLRVLMKSPLCSV